MNKNIEIKERERNSLKDSIDLQKKKLKASKQKYLIKVKNKD